MCDISAIARVRFIACLMPELTVNQLLRLLSKVMRFSWRMLKPMVRENSS